MAALPPPSGAGHVVAPGTVFHGTLEVVRSIQAGGMGAVYEVVHVPTQRHRALKLMHPALVDSEDMRARFEREARVAAKVDSEHIVETIDAGVDEATGVPFILMELLKGMELGKLLKSRGRFSAIEVVAVIAQVARALELTHAASVVHRDLKPGNLFLSLRDDGSVRVKVLDFGVAKITASVTAASTGTVGTPLYMAPEQLQGKGGITGRTDLYALAHVVYTLLVGRPFWAEEQKTMDGVLAFLMRVFYGEQEAATVRAARAGVKLPAAFDPWFVRATARDPAARFEGAASMAAALAEVLGGTEVLMGGMTGEVAALSDLVAPLASPRASSADLAAEVLLQSGGAHARAFHDSGSSRPITTPTSTHGAIVSDAGAPRSSRMPLIAALIATTLTVAVAAIVVVSMSTSETPAGAASQTSSPAPATTTATSSATRPTPELAPSATAAVSASASASGAQSAVPKTAADRGGKPAGKRPAATATPKSKPGGNPLDTY